MDGWLHYQLKMDQLLAEAARERLLKAAAQTRLDGPTIGERLLKGLGRKLMLWGRRLETYGQRPAEPVRRELAA
jgi:hypothetical protein